MTKYVLYNGEGEILQTGSAPEDELQLQIRDGLFLLVGDADCLTDSVDPATGEIIKGGAPVPPPQASAPQAPQLTVGVQLDLLWQAMDSGTFPKAEPFYSAVKAQKAAQ